MRVTEAEGLQPGADNAITTRIGAVALPLGVILIAVSEVLHPSREDPMNFPAVFREYAHSNFWTTVHLGEYFGFLLLLGGLVALFYSIGTRRDVGAGIAPFGLAAAVTTAASFTVLQAVDGVTLKYAVDNWVNAPAPQQTAAFAAAEMARWSEIGMNSLSYFLAGLTLFIYGLAIAFGGVYPRLTGLMVAISGAALMYDGAVVVAFRGFVPDIFKLLGLVLLAVWAFIMCVLMWRNSSQRRMASHESDPAQPAQQPASTN